MKSLWASFADKSILELDAGERSSGHHRIIPSASTIRVELPWREARGNNSGRRLELTLLGEKPSIGRDHIIVDSKLLLILNFNRRWFFLEIPFALQVLGGGADPGDTAGR